MYSKRPKVTRFQMQKTRAGRIVRKATVERREPKRAERTARPVRQMRKRVVTGR